MVDVNLWSSLRPLADGKDRVEVDATNVREMFAALVAAYPGLKPVIDAGVSVSIDGQMISGGLSEPVGPNTEVFLLQRLKGG